MIQQNELVDIFLREESKGDCWTLNFGGISLWPLLRMCLYFAWRSKQTALSEPADTGLTFNPDSLLSGEFEITQEAGKKQVMLISRDDALNDKVDGKLFDKFISSIAILFSRFHDIAVVSYTPEKENRFGHTVDLSRHIDLSNNEFSLNISREDLNIIESYISYICDECRLSVTLETLLHAFGYCARGQSFWSKIFEESRPDIVITTCFYEPFLTGACVAARERGIRFIDMQHGRVGTNHPVMSNWDFRKAQSDVGNFFPSDFWCWTEENVRQIQTTWKGSEDIPKTSVFGNPWQFVRSKKIIDEKSARIGKSSNRIVLVALQPIPDSFPLFMIQALKKYPDLRVWVRPHPHQIGAVSEIENAVREKGLRNFLIKSNTELYSEFEQIDLVITAFSTVATEACDFGLPVILTHPNAEAAFAGMIDNQKIFYCSNEIESINALQVCTSGTEVKFCRESTALPDFESMARCFD